MIWFSMAVVLSRVSSCLIVLPLSCCCERLLYQVRQRLSTHLTVEFNPCLKDGECGGDFQDGEKHCVTLVGRVSYVPYYRNLSSQVKAAPHSQRVNPAFSQKFLFPFGTPFAKGFFAGLARRLPTCRRKSLLRKDLRKGAGADFFLS